MVQQTLFTQAPIAEVSEATLRAALQAPFIALDVETQTAWPGSGPEFEYGLSYPAEVTHIAAAWDSGSFVSAPCAAISAFLCSLFDSSHVVIGHNLIFDLRQLSKYVNGKTPESVWDTKAMAYLLHAKAGASYGLLAVAEDLGIEYPAWMTDMKKKRGALHLLESDQVETYVAADARLTLAVYHKQIELVNSPELYSLVDWECLATRCYAQMTAKGVALNVDYVRQRVLDISALVKEKAAVLREDGLLLPNSPQARVKYIYERKSIPRPESTDENRVLFTAKGGLSTGQEAIDRLVEISPENAEKLKDLVIYLRADKVLQTLQSLLDHGVVDGRLHSLVTVATDTGRRSASHPQVQNWSMVASEDDPVGCMAGVVMGDEGSTLVEIDYQGAELWMIALVSGDDKFSEALHGSDFHSTMAELYFGDEFKNAKGNDRKLLRKKAKQFTFGMLYGMGPKSLAARLGASIQRAYQLLDALRINFPDFMEFKEYAESIAKQRGYIYLWTGRKVPIDPNRLYTCCDYAAQGGVAEMLKRAIVLITDEYEARSLRSRVALDMHDALILSVRHDEWKEAIQIAMRIMSSVMPEEKNASTNPPVRWIAEPDFDENKKKWGKYQIHFDTSAGEADVLLADEEYSEVPNTCLVEFADLGIRQEVQTRADWLRVFHEVYEALNTRLQALNGPYQTCLPVLRDGLIDVGDPIEVDLANWVLVAQAWLQVAESGVDTDALIGLSTAGLLAELARRQARLAEKDALDERLAKVIEAMGAI